MAACSTIASAGTSVPVSGSAWPPCIGRAGPWAGGTKKKLTAAERDEAERADWRQAHASLEPTELVFVDESGSNLARALRYGWALGGQRAWGKAPTNRGKNTTLFAALTHEGLLASMTVEGAANTEAFLTYLDEVLCPALRPGRVVLMDNLQVHKA